MSRKLEGKVALVTGGSSGIGETIATAESCTAGLLAGRIADRPGSSAYLIGGFVTYANEAKTTEVGVPLSRTSRFPGERA